jgi:hypothetical protein
MPRNGAITFSDLIGKLDLLRVSCEKCGRDGCYGLRRLIAKRGREASSQIGSVNFQPVSEEDCTQHE